MLEKQKQQKELADCVERLKAKELEEQRLLAEQKGSRHHRDSQPKLARISAAVVAEQRQVVEIRKSLQQLESRPQAVNVRKMIEAYNKMVEKEEAERKCREVEQELRTLKKRVQQVQKIKDKIKDLDDISKAVKKASSILEAEPHVQKAGLSKDNTQAKAKKEEDPGKGAGGKKEHTKAAKEEQRQPAGKDERRKAARRAAFPKNTKWKDIFKANMQGNCPKIAKNQNQVKSTAKVTPNTQEDPLKNSKWHNIFMAATRGGPPKDIYKSNRKDKSSNAAKNDARNRDQRKDAGKENMQKEPGTRKADDQNNLATPGDRPRAAVKECVQKDYRETETLKEIPRPAPKFNHKLDKNEDFPKGEPRKSATHNDHRRSQRAAEIDELPEEDPQDNEYTDEQNFKLERKIVAEIKKAMNFHNELRCLESQEKLNAQVQECQRREKTNNEEDRNQRAREQKKREYQEELLQETPREEWELQSYRPNHGESSDSKSRGRQIPNMKEIAERKARIVRACREARAKTEAAMAERDKCAREIERIEVQQRKLRAAPDPSSSSTFSSFQTRAGPRFTMVGQYSSNSNAYQVNHRPAPAPRRACDPVLSYVDSISDLVWTDISSDYTTGDSEEAEEEEEYEEDSPNYLALFEDNCRIFSHLLMAAHYLDRNLKALLGGDYDGACEVLNVEREATLMIELEGRPIVNSYRYRKLATKLLHLLGEMQKQYYDELDAQLAEVN
ncbi:hypothetical protein KR200_011083 [Drosophila serrata]|nr:hypothetical protein KR200_011083 [Drosophila serrata]